MVLELKSFCRKCGSGNVENDRDGVTVFCTDCYRVSPKYSYTEEMRPKTFDYVRIRLAKSFEEVLK